MRHLRFSVLLASGSFAVWAQGPVVLQRDVVNAVTMQPAPSRVARGGIIRITGFNLGAPGGLKAQGTPLPTQLGDVQVLINGTAAPLYSIDPGTILAQVPLEAANGLAELAVQRASGKSLVARFNIVPTEPAVRTMNGLGYGPAAGAMSGRTLTLSASGLGPTNPPLVTGDAAPAESPAQPTLPVSVFVGGIEASASAVASTKRVGEFDLQVEMPSGARPGDAIQLIVGNQASAQVTTFASMKVPDVQFLSIPEGAPDLQSITDTDLNGNFAIATSARDTGGCFAGFVFDFMKQKVSALPDCLTSAARDPIVTPAGSNVAGALVGPPQGAPPAAISSTVAIFGPALDQPIMASLPSPASILMQSAGGNFCAVIPGPPAQGVEVDGLSGEVRPGRCSLGNVAAGGAAFNPANLNVDGLTRALTPVVNLGQGRFALVAGDDTDQPTRAEFIVVNQTGTAVLTKAFPDGWLPLIAPAPPAPPTPPNAPPGGQGPGVAVSRPRGSMYYDTGARLFYALAHTPDNAKHGFVAFPLDRSDAKVVSFPDGWFAAACTPNISIATLQLSQTAAIMGSRDGTIKIATPCTADGFIQLDPAKGATIAIALPTQAQMNAALGLNADVNDYVYSYNPPTRGVTDTIYVLDGSTVSATLLQPLLAPGGISGFQPPAALPQLGMLLAVAANRAPGDAGLLLFDLDNSAVRVLAVPDGFVSVSEAGVFRATRKLLARGTLPNRRGSQFLIYDIDTGELAKVPNPDGVVFVGERPAAAPGMPQPPGVPGAPGGAVAGRGLFAANPNANTVTAIVFDAAGKQLGVMAVRIP